MADRRVKYFLKMMQGIHQPQMQKVANSCSHWKSSLTHYTVFKWEDKSEWMGFGLFVEYFSFLGLPDLL